MDVREIHFLCVIIDKLPFTAPDDPLLRARIEDCQLRGGDAFRDVQIPDAGDHSKARCRAFDPRYT